MIDDFRPVKRPAKSLQASSHTRSKKALKSENFRTPEEVAAETTLEAKVDDILDTPSAAPANESSAPPASARSMTLPAWFQNLNLHWPPGKKEAGVAAVVLLLVIGGLAIALRPDNAAPQASVHTVAKAKPTAPPKANTVPSNLSGLPVEPAVNNRPVTGVMIENSVDARPQSGLNEASVVFEAVAEGGITRFLALFQDTAPDNIGPIRSARPYYVQWALGFDAAYAHVGGSPEALNDIKSWGVRDLDQFANGGSYHRVDNREAPHNVYTGMSNLNQLEAAKGYTSSSFTGFPRKKVAPSKTPTAKTIDLKLSGPLYNVHYDYDPSTNNYKRSEGGAPHIDANSNAQISPKVVIALDIPYGLQSDGHHNEYQTIGSGSAYVFQDGTVTTGTWTKLSEKSQIVLSDSAGQPLLLNPGPTWFTAISGASAVNYAP